MALSQEDTTGSSALERLRTPQCCLSPALMMAPGHLGSCWSSAPSFQPTRGPREASTATRRRQRPLRRGAHRRVYPYPAATPGKAHSPSERVFPHLQAKYAQAFRTIRKQLSSCGQGPTARLEARLLQENVCVLKSKIHTCRTTYAFLTTLLHACLGMSVCMCPRRQKRMLEPWSYRWP